MRKPLYVVLFVLLVAAGIHGQALYLIPKAGLNLANTTHTTGTIKPGLHFGLSAEYMFTPAFAAEAGFSYSMQGAKFGHENVDLKHDYLNIPVLAKYYVYNGFNIFAGPQLGFKINSSKIGFGGEHIGDLLDRDMTKPVDFSAVIGAGYLFDTGLLFSVNVAVGLTDISEDEILFENEPYAIEDETHRNWMIQLNFGYRF
ncbi:MAG: PorT family protein [Tannerellaceae bacterium]|jgi:hypothetical protein|nr:PorT family protein [Tannerellaceae bacterium]